MGSYISTDNNKIKDIEFAILPEEQEKGLMFEKDPKILVFLYTCPKIRKFWMKNCSFPLDIVFIKNNKIISIEEGKPNCEENIGPDEECDYVIEFPFDYCKDNDLSIDSNISLKLDKKVLKKLFDK